MKRHEGKKVVIIGGTSGMGLATAKMLCDGGPRLLVTDRSEAGLDSAEQELGSDAIVVSSDVRSLADINALASRVRLRCDPSLGYSPLSFFLGRFASTRCRPAPPTRRS